MAGTLRSALLSIEIPRPHNIRARHFLSWDRSGRRADAAALARFPVCLAQYTRLIDRLSDPVHLIAPDYPGFGYSSAPTSSNDG
jgi:hypothetical protein